LCEAIIENKVKDENIVDHCCLAIGCHTRQLYLHKVELLADLMRRLVMICRSSSSTARLMSAIKIVSDIACFNVQNANLLSKFNVLNILNGFLNNSSI
jgi:hypothetical protein